MTIAVGYCRRSSHDEESGSIADQERAIRAQPEVAACDEIHMIRDQSLSGADPNRPGLLELYKWIENPATSVIAFYHQDRLARDEEINAVLGRMLKAKPNIAVYSVAQGGRMNFDPTGKLAWGIHGSFNAYLRELIAERMRASYARRRELGQWVAPKAPYGYRRNGKDTVIEPDPEIAPFVRQTFELAAEGNHTLREIAAEMVRRGAPALSGRRNWTPQTVSIILNRIAYAGRTVIDGEETSGMWEAIVSLELYRAVQDRLQRRERSAYAPARTLRGLLRCGCGQRLQGHSGREHIYYVCYSRRLLTPCDHARSSVRESVLLGQLDQVFGALRDHGFEFRTMAERQATKIGPTVAEQIAKLEDRINPDFS